MNQEKFKNQKKENSSNSNLTLSNQSKSELFNFAQKNNLNNLFNSSFEYMLNCIKIF